MATTKKTTAAKAVETKVENTAKVVEKKPAAEKAVKETAKKAAATTETAAKKAATKTTAAAKKTAAKFEPKKTTVTVEANGKSFTYDDVVKAVTKACKGKTAKKLEIYVNANEGVAYYVLDGVGSDEYKVEL